MDAEKNMEREALRMLVEEINQAEDSGDDELATMLRSVIPWGITEVVPGLVGPLSEDPDDTAVHTARVMANELCRVLTIGQVSRDEEPPAVVNETATAIMEVAGHRGLTGLTREFSETLKVAADHIEATRKAVWDPVVYSLFKLAPTDAEKIDAFDTWSILPGVVTLDAARRGSVMFMLARRIRGLSSGLNGEVVES